MKIDIFEKASSALKAVTNVGTGTIISTLSTVCITSCPLPIKACVYVGSYIFSMMLSEKTDEYIDRKTEEYRHELEDMKAMTEAIGQDTTIEEG